MVTDKKVGDVELWDWDEVARQIAKLYKKELG